VHLRASGLTISMMRCQNHRPTLLSVLGTLFDHQCTT
jgi:hypothetical protein